MFSSEIIVPHKIVGRNKKQAKSLFLDVPTMKKSPTQDKNNDNNSRNTEMETSNYIPTKSGKKAKTNKKPAYSSKEYDALMKRIGENICNYDDFNELEFAEGCLIYLLIGDSSFQSMDWQDLMDNHISRNVWSEQVVYILINFASNRNTIDTILTSNRQMKKERGFFSRDTNGKYNEDSEDSKESEPEQIKKRKYVDKVDRIFTKHQTLPIQLLESLRTNLRIKERKTLFNKSKKTFSKGK